MTPADEATFIELWQQGASYRAIAQALGCPLGTVASRSAALVAQGENSAAPTRGCHSTRQGPAGGRTRTSAETITDLGLQA